jgi:hypothetical protein
MTKTMQHAHEVAEDERFAFGANWWRFLKVLNSAFIVGDTGRVVLPGTPRGNLRGVA